MVGKDVSLHPWIRPWVNVPCDGVKMARLRSYRL